MIELARKTLTAGFKTYAEILGDRLCKLSCRWPFFTSCRVGVCGFDPLCRCHMLTFSVTFPSGQRWPSPLKVTVSVLSAGVVTWDLEKGTLEPLDWVKDMCVCVCVCVCLCVSVCARVCLRTRASS